MLLQAKPKSFNHTTYIYTFNSHTLNPFYVGLNVLFSIILILIWDAVLQFYIPYKQILDFLWWKFVCLWGIFYDRTRDTDTMFEDKRISFLDSFVLEPHTTYKKYRIDSHLTHY